MLSQNQWNTEHRQPITDEGLMNSKLQSVFRARSSVFQAGLETPSFLPMVLSAG